MQITKTIKLTPPLIDKIKEFCPVMKFTVNSPLFYEGQVPIVAYLIITGRISLFKTKKIKNIIKEGNIVGLSELITNSPSQLNGEVSSESSLCFLDKSTMIELLKFENSEISTFLKSIIDMHIARDS